MSWSGSVAHCLTLELLGLARNQERGNLRCSRSRHCLLHLFAPFSPFLLHDTSVGRFSVKITVGNPLDPAKSATVECLVDTGAAYSRLPSDLLDSLGITHFDERPAIFADGRRSLCRVGRAEFIYHARQTPALVVLGEPGAPALLGAMTLECLGLGVDPIGNRLIPIEIPMAALPAATASPYSQLWLSSRLSC